MFFIEFVFNENMLYFCIQVYIMKRKIHKKTLSPSAKKIVEDQQFIREYLNGNKTIKNLNERGIKLATPVQL